MENENKDTILQFETNQNFFKLDYIDQDVSKNKNFQSWKSSQIKAYGQNGKIFKCEKENLFFFVPKSGYFRRPYYQSECPSCHKKICYFCKRFSNETYRLGDCCIRRRIIVMFYEEGFRFINEGYENRTFITFERGFLLFIIPVISLWLFIAEIDTSFFYKLSMANEESSERGYITNYEDFMKRRKYERITILVVINIAMSVVLSIPFILLFFSFHIFIIIISLPFKLLPLKHYVGMIYGNF